MQYSKLKDIISYGLIILCTTLVAMKIPAFADSLTLGTFLRWILLPVAAFMVLLLVVQTWHEGWGLPRLSLPSGKLPIVLLPSTAFLLGFLFARYGEVLGLVTGLFFGLVVILYFLALYFIIIGKVHYALATFLLAMPWLEFVEWEIGAKYGLFDLMIGEIALPIKGMYIFIASMFMAWVANKLLRGTSYLTKPLVYGPIALFLLCNFVSFLLFTYSHNRERALDNIVNSLFVPFLLYILAVETVDTEYKFNLLVYSLIAQALVWSFIKFYVVARAGYITFELVEMEEYVNLYSSAGEMALITPLLLAVLATVKKGRYILLTVGLIVYAFVMQLLYLTRSGLGATLAGAACLLASRKIQLFAILSVIFVLIFWDQIYSNLLIRFWDIHSFEDLALERLSYSRWQAWNAAISMLREQPVLGVGLGNFLDYAPRFMRPISTGSGQPPVYMESAHNLFLNVAAQLGLVGGGILLLFLGMVLHELMRGLLAVRGGRLEPLGWGLLGVYVAHIVLALFGHGFWRWRGFTTVTTMYWMLFALMVRLRWVGNKMGSESITSGGSP